MQSSAFLSRRSQKKMAQEWDTVEAFEDASLFKDRRAKERRASASQSRQVLAQTPAMPASDPIPKVDETPKDALDELKVPLPLPHHSPLPPSSTGTKGPSQASPN